MKPEPDSRAADSPGSKTPRESSGLDLLAQAVIDNPYPAFAKLRESDPVHWSTRHRSWILTRYDDVRDALKSTALSAELGEELLDHVPAAHPLHRYIRRWMVFSDPPDHTRLRGLVSRAFTPGVIAKLDATVQDIVDEIARALPERGTGDFMRDFAMPLPAIVIAELFGLPRADRERIGAWSNAISAITFRELGTERFETGARAMDEFAGYLGQHVERVRAKPGEDMLSRLVGAREQGDLLSEEELVGTVMLFLFAGHETTSALLGNAMVSLTTHGDGLRTVAACHDIGTAVEELLRFDGPGRFLVRHVTAPCAFGGTPMRAGQRVFIAISAANRDPAMFDAPDGLDLRRDPNRHVGFGVGMHYCLGANLARLETRIALRTLAARFPGLNVDPDACVWRPVILSRSLQRLPYRL